MNSITPDKDRIFKCPKCGEWGPDFDCKCGAMHKGETASVSPGSLDNICDTIDEYEKKFFPEQYQKKRSPAKKLPMGCWIAIIGAIILVSILLIILLFAIISQPSWK